jgi:hypothetical protein
MRLPESVKTSGAERPVSRWVFCTALLPRPRIGPGLHPLSEVGAAGDADAALPVGRNRSPRAQAAAAWSG